MDGMRFGRWIGDRRRARGWTSQRALIESAQHDAVLRGAGISEDFLARLEAGKVVFPLRGKVRRRVLQLARLLCASSSELRSYLRAAGIDSLSPAEQELLSAVRSSLAARTAAPARLLPPRPEHLFGRESVLAQLVEALASGGDELYCLTGMPGVGKSALAHEAVHALACDPEGRWLQRFPDGIAVFTCRGRRGAAGLAALLDDICEVLAPQRAAARRPGYLTASSGTGGASSVPQSEIDGMLAQVVDRARVALARTRALIVLDDLDPCLPLDRALDALLVPTPLRDHGGPPPAGGGAQMRASGSIVMTTSRHVPVPLRRAFRVALEPLSPAATLDFFAAALERTPDAHEAVAVATIGEALGHLPLALELAAAVVVGRHIPLDMLATHLREHPLDRLLDGDGELHARIADALAMVDDASRRRFALLAALSAETFSIEAASALDVDTRDASTARRALMECAAGEGGRRSDLPWQRLASAIDDAGADLPKGDARSKLASATADLGALVQHSMLQTLPASVRETWNARGTTDPPEKAAAETTASQRYRIHPVIRAYAAEQFDALEMESREQAAQRVRDYALGYAERHCNSRVALEREHDVLISSLLATAEAGQRTQARALALQLRGVVGRRGLDPMGERALLAGARAAYELRDRHALVHLLYRLGLLHYYRGANRSARRIWEDALTFTPGLDDLAYMRLPVRGLGFLAATCSEQEAALRYAAAYKQACLDSGDSMATAGAMISHAFQLRVMGRPVQAHEDARACADIVLPVDQGEAMPYEHIVAIEACVELARLAGDYQCAQELTEACFGLNERYRDFFMAVECLADQAEFAFSVGARQDALALARRIEESARDIGALSLMGRARALLDAS